MTAFKNGVTPAAGVPNAKTMAALVAEFAVKGHVLRISTHQDGSSSYTVSRWNQSRHFTRLSEVQAFLVQIGGCI